MASKSLRSTPSPAASSMWNLYYLPRLLSGFCLSCSWFESIVLPAITRWRLYTSLVAGWTKPFEGALTGAISTTLESTSSESWMSFFPTCRDEDHLSCAYVSLGRGHCGEHHRKSPQEPPHTLPAQPSLPPQQAVLFRDEAGHSLLASGVWGRSDWLSCFWRRSCLSSCPLTTGWHGQEENRHRLAWGVPTTDGILW